MDKFKILLIEDEPVLAMLIKETLETQGFEISVGVNGMEGWSLFKNKKPDLCIVDVFMPKKDGFSLVEDIRGVDQLTPIIFLTARTQTEDVLKGLEIGADDYMKKPFSMEELILRIRNLLRRANTNGDTESNKEAVAIGSYKFNHQRLTLSRDEASHHLTQREADLLDMLVKNKNRLLERKTALLKLWGDDNGFNARSMDVYIARLRKFLVKDSSVEIQNVRGYGYKLID
jgi:two-component system, OmpR family, response regulator TrcR